MPQLDRLGSRLTSVVQTWQLGNCRGGCILGAAEAADSHVRCMEGNQGGGAQHLV